MELRQKIGTGLMAVLMSIGVGSGCMTSVDTAKMARQSNLGVLRRLTRKYSGFERAHINLCTRQKCDAKTNEYLCNKLDWYSFRLGQLAKDPATGVTREDEFSRRVLRRKKGLDNYISKHCK
ncbi:MAG: hypothetical protein U9Q69_01015 [Nanoarchaeota archaeon]|nr:hypothetical protein [Nanoarchaeota archaeon]